jgi:hypothetical protein
MTYPSWAKSILVFENILWTLYIISYGRLFGYRNAFDAASINLYLNAYFDKCLEIIATFYDFTIQHFFIDENTVVNDLA